MKILAFSDTHALHRSMPPPPPHDLAIFAGNCGGERLGRFVDFLDWFVELTDKPKVLIYGNHERWAEKHPKEARFLVEERCIHLLMSKMIAVEGVTIWGCPYTPVFCDWAFMDDNYDWERIPERVDVVVTHGPPKYTLDETLWRECAGSLGLRDTLNRRDFKAHMFGHIHEARGIDGRYHNVSCVTREYELYPEPWTVIEI